MSNEKTNWKAISYASIAVTITSVVIWNLFNRVIFEESIYRAGRAFFSAEQPSYFPIFYLLATFVATFVIVWVYQILLTGLPKNLIIRSLIIGAILFLVIDLPYMIQISFTTVLPGKAAQSMVLAALLSKIAYGFILTYTYRRFSPDAEA
jgi:hypothetical protein